MSVFKNSCTVERVRGLQESQRKVVIAGYSWFAMGKELKLSRSQGMYVIFAKDDQGSGLGQIMRWFSHREVKDQVLVVKKKLKWG
ncbi:hypothetical protein F2Q68_00008909 [Brassica cretica]|uniref:Uncharacterized protein n=1 Tax=Brassica cretica TaxID=69181 RepID=A0A3N6T085_BRACR|nr:hypothetical protein F2Q68_00008909 [Brassica cretica]